MRELQADLWSVPADAVVITTNGFVKRNGEAVMGRGCAQEARDRGYLPAAMFGDRLARYGNHTAVFRDRDLGEGRVVDLVTLPVKHKWDEVADPILIDRSVDELVLIANAMDWRTVVMPRPGCGNGQLPWETVVRPLLRGLDDRFIVVDFPVYEVAI